MLRMVDPKKLPAMFWSFQVRLVSFALRNCTEIFGRIDSLRIRLTTVGAALTVLIPLLPANGQLRPDRLELPIIEPGTAPAPMFTGRWDFIPTIAPDNVPSIVRVTPNGDVWIAGNGAVLRRTTRSDAFLVDRWADGREEAIPSIISHDMIVLGDDRVLVSTIWREIYIATPEGLIEVNTKGIKGSYSFSALHDGRMAIGLDDWRLADDFAERLAVAIGQPVIIVLGAERLVSIDERLFSITNGSITEIDLETGKRFPFFPYTTDDDSISSVRPANNGKMLIAATPHYDKGGCFIVSTGREPTVQRLYEGACYDLIETATGEYWASTSTGIVRFDGAGWRTYFSDSPNGIGRAGKFAKTDTGSLWVATTDGLWRHYTHTRELPTIAKGQISSLHRDASDRLFIGDDKGTVSVLAANSWRTLLPATPKVSPYSRLPLFAESTNGVVWILHEKGFYKYDEAGLTRVSDSPRSKNTVAPASLAVCPNGSIFVGFNLSTEIKRLNSGIWEREFSLQSHVGGAATSDLACDAENHLWALGTETVGLRTRSGNWLETGAFKLRANAKANLFGALSLRPGDWAVTAWGAWGYPVSVRYDAPVLAAAADTITNDAPYVFYDAAALSGDVDAVLTDRGVFIRNEHGFVRVPIVEERLQRRTTAFGIALDPESAFGFRLDLAAENTLFEVAPPRYVPELRLAEIPPGVVSRAFVKLTYALDSRGYPTEEGVLRISLDPPLGGVRNFSAGPEGTLTLTGLVPDTRYTIEAQFTDLAGQVSDPVQTKITYRRPWAEDPRVWGFAALAILVGLIVGARSPVMLDIVLRRLGRRRWCILLDDVDRTISLSTNQDGQIETVLSAAGATLRLAAVSETGGFPFNALRNDLLTLSTLAPRTRSPAGKLEFSKTLEAMKHQLNSNLPSQVRYELQTFSGKSVMFDVTRDLSGIPWDMLDGPEDQPIFANTAVSRVIRTDRIAEHPGLSGRLSAAIFAADAGSAPEAQVWREEQRALAHAMRRAGVLDVRMPTAVAHVSDVAELIDGVDLLHLIGHASVSRSGNETARFWLTPTVALDHESLSRLLKRAKHPPSLIFINACGSLEERQDLGGSAIAGLATPFLEYGCTVVGTHWPVQTTFATELAIEFYSLALPPPNALFWRWIRRRPLEGRTFAEALGDARCALYQRRPHTDPTWSAYSIFGNPTARLSLI